MIFGLAPFRGDFQPTFYNYGSLYLILSRVAIDLCAGYGFVNPYLKLQPGWPVEFARLILVGRVVAVALALGTVLLAYATARRLYGRRPGWLAALFLAVAPAHVVLAHYMAVDVPATFFVTLTLYLCARALPPPTGFGWRSFLGRWLLIGAAAGLAAGTKYNAGLVLLAALAPLTAAHPPWSRWWPRRPGGGQRATGPNLGARASLPADVRPPGLGLWFFGLALLGAGAALALLASTPGILSESRKFWLDFTYEVQHTGEGHGLVFRMLPPAALYHAGVSLPLALSWPLYALGVAGVLWAAFRRRPCDWLLLLAVVPPYLVLARSELRFVRYVVPLVPVLAILAARFLVALAAILRGLSWPHAAAFARGVLWVAASAALVGALGSSVAHDRVMAGEDPRETAARWLARSTPRGATVALAHSPWFDTPPLHPTAGAVTWAASFGGPPVWDEEVVRRQAHVAPRPYPVGGYLVLSPHAAYPERWGVRSGWLSVEDLRRYRPERVVVTDYEYADALRIQPRLPDEPAIQPAVALLDDLGRNYVLEKEFRIRPRFLGWEWFGARTPPHDWAYFMPTIRVYRRKS